METSSRSSSVSLVRHSRHLSHTSSHRTAPPDPTPHASSCLDVSTTRSPGNTINSPRRWQSADTCRPPRQRDPAPRGSETPGSTATASEHDSRRPVPRPPQTCDRGLVHEYRRRDRRARTHGRRRRETSPSSARPDTRRRSTDAIGSCPSVPVIQPAAPENLPRASSGSRFASLSRFRLMATSPTAREMVKARVGPSAIVRPPERRILGHGPRAHWLNSRRTPPSSLREPVTLISRAGPQQRSADDPGTLPIPGPQRGVHPIPHLRALTTGPVRHTSTSRRPTNPVSVADGSRADAPHPRSRSPGCSISARSARCRCSSPF